MDEADLRPLDTREDLTGLLATDDEGADVGEGAGVGVDVDTDSSAGDLRLEEDSARGVGQVVDGPERGVGHGDPS